jgi:hypothetical protein
MLDENERRNEIMGKDFEGDIVVSCGDVLTFFWIDLGIFLLDGF